jgi:hypothetical protein
MCRIDSTLTFVSAAFCAPGHAPVLYSAQLISACNRKLTWHTLACSGPFAKCWAWGTLVIPVRGAIGTSAIVPVPATMRRLDQAMLLPWSLVMKEKL